MSPYIVFGYVFAITSHLFLFQNVLNLSASTLCYFASLKSIYMDIYHLGMSKGMTVKTAYAIMGS